MRATGPFRSRRRPFRRAGEVFGACAAAALYRRDALLEVGGFDERFFAYLEDVDLALRLRLAGWRCRYEPTVALHAGESSSRNLVGGHMFLVQRNTLLLVAKWFPVGWLPLVSYRQVGWAWHAGRRGALRRGAQIPVEVAVPAVPISHGSGFRWRRRAPAPAPSCVTTRRPPIGGGRPVMLIPGFMAGAATCVGVRSTAPPPVEVDTSHIGMGWAREVAALAAELARVQGVPA